MPTETEERDKLLLKKVMELYVLQSPFNISKQDPNKTAQIHKDVFKDLRQDVEQVPEKIVHARRDIFKLLREGADPNVRNSFGRLALLYVMDERVALAFAGTGRLTEEVKREYLDKIDEDLQIRWARRYTAARKIVEPVISVVSRSLERPQKKRQTRYVRSPKTLKGQVTLLLLNGWTKREKYGEYPQQRHSEQTLLALSDHCIRQNFFLITKKVKEHIIKHVSLMNKPVQNDLGITPVMCAVNQGNKDTAQLLVDWGMSPDIKNAYGETALMYAAANGDFEMLSMLMKKSKDFKEKAGKGSRYKGLDALDVLGVNVSATDYSLFLEKLSYVFPNEGKYLSEKNEKFKKLRPKVRKMMHKMAQSRKKEEVKNKNVFFDRER